MEIVTVHLLPTEIETLMIKANGRGGYQSLIRKLQSKLDSQSGNIDLDQSEIERILKTANYGEGTFQSRLYEVFSRSLS